MRIRETVKVKSNGKEVLIKDLVLFVLAHVFSMIVGYVGMKNKEIYRSFISGKDEKSLFNLGQLLIFMNLWEDLLVDWFHCKLNYFFSDYR